LSRTGKNTFISLLVSFAALAGGGTYAQNLKDTLILREFEVVGSYPVNNIGFKKVHLDSILLMPNISSDLSTILSQYSTIFIKSYGSGSLSTPSFRGTSAHHTQVEWNGITLNSPMLGQTDLSQLPVSQFDAIEILYGGASIFSSGGAFGGIVNLTTTPDWNNRLNLLLAQSLASFGTYNTVLSAAAGTDKFQSITKANFTTSENNFKYYDDNLDSVRELTNGSWYQYGLSEDLFFRFKEKHFLSVKAWYSHDFREIPPNMTYLGPSYSDNQENESLRSLAEYKFLEKRYNITVRSAFIDDYLRYRNDTMDARHRYYSSINRIRFNWLGTKNLTIKPGLDFTYDWVHSDAYEELKTRMLTGLFGEVVWVAGKNVKVSLVLREDVVDGSLMPFIFAGGAEYRPVLAWNWSFSANISRNYRVPTLNDKYWSVSGNPDLQPEESVTAEAGSVFNYQTRNGRFFTEGQLTGYYSWIDNLIIWQPVPGNSFLWSPVNLKTVHARGLEAGLNLKYKNGPWEAAVNTNYNFCRSTNEDSGGGEGSQDGKQLIYIPVNTLNATLNAGWKSFYLSYNFLYTSRRYTGTDNETYMPGYNLSNIFLGKNMHMDNFVLSLQLEINNLFDLDYQSIANRPMPGRNYAVTLRGGFRK
jgi:outer membrane cobalamin receptor